MGLFEKRVTLKYAPDPRLQGALGLPRPVRVGFTPVVDGRPPQSMRSVGDFKNLFGMTLGNCHLVNGEPTAVIGEAVHQALGMSGFGWVAPDAPEAELTFHARLDALWGEGTVTMTGQVEATAAMSAMLARQGTTIFERSYYGQGRADSFWGITQGLFQQSLTQALQALAYYVAADPDVGAAIRANVPDL